MTGSYPAQFGRDARNVILTYATYIDPKPWAQAIRTGRRITEKHFCALAAPDPLDRFAASLLAVQANAAVATNP